MSLPAMEIRCTACAFQASDTITWGTREYILNNGVRVSGRSELGRCYDCQNVEAIENLDTAVWVLQIAKAKAALDVPPPPSPAPAPFWHLGHWFASKERDTPLSRWQEQQDQAQEELDDATDMLAMIQSRTSPRRCFTCGSHNVTAPLIPNDLSWPMGDETRPFGFIHPECGGELFMANSGIRFALRPSIFRYTAEGSMIERIHVGGYSSPEHLYFEERRQNNVRCRGTKGAASMSAPPKSNA